MTSCVRALGDLKRFLGLLLDSVPHLPVSMQRSFLECLLEFQLGIQISRRTCLRLLGLMAAMVQVDPLMLLHMRPVQRYLLMLGLAPQDSPQALTLHWWRNPVDISRGRPLGLVTHCRLIFTDASLFGWGAVCDGVGSGGSLGSPRGCCPHEPPGAAGCPIWPCCNFCTCWEPPTLLFVRSS